jgi:choline-glycine betaine transporter
MVFVKVMPDDPAEADEFYRSLKVGDVLTFRYVYTTQVTITHRITSITEKDTGGFVIELAGDNKNAEDGQLIQSIDTSIPNSTNYVIGKVTGQAYWLRLTMSFLMQPIGIILIIIVPCFIIILLEIFKIARVLGADKKKREQEEKEQKESELEELRRKLAELEKDKTDRAVVETVSDESSDNKEEKTE